MQMLEATNVCKRFGKGASLTAYGGAGYRKFDYLAPTMMMGVIP